MERQLALLQNSAGPHGTGHDGADRPVEPEWRLDEHTRQVGRAGVAKARAALREALARSATERTAA